MEAPITITRNIEAEEACEVESINIGYLVHDSPYNKGECEVQIMCELKFLPGNNKNKKKSYKFSFAILDVNSQLIGTDYNVCARVDYQIVNIFSLEVRCRGNKNKVKQIKSYICEY